jgi:hypothetical protein
VPGLPLRCKHDRSKCHARRDAACGVNRLHRRRGAATTASDDRVADMHSRYLGRDRQNVFRMEIPPHGLVRLVALIWTDRWMHAALSLFVRPWELTTLMRERLGQQLYVYVRRVDADTGHFFVSERSPAGRQLPLPI